MINEQNKKPGSDIAEDISENHTTTKPESKPSFLIKVFHRIRRSQFTLSLPVIIVIIVLFFVFGTSLLNKFKYLFAWNEVQHSTMTLLSNERMKFLVTDRLVTQVIVEHEGESLFMGKEDRLLIAVVKLYYGIDLEKIREDNIKKRDGKIVVLLPDPEPLDRSIETGSLRIFKKRSGLNWIKEKLGDKEEEKLFEVLQKADDTAMAFFQSHQLLPTRSKIVNDMNEWSGIFSKNLGVPIQFE